MNRTKWNEKKFYLNFLANPTRLSTVFVQFLFFCFTSTSDIIMWNNGRHNMGAKTPSPYPYPNQPNNHTTSPLSILHLQPNPLLPQLGLSSYPLQKVQLNLPFSSPKLGFLSFPQKGLQIWAPRDLVEVQVPIPTASTVDSRKGSGGSSVGWRTKERICQEEAQQETPWKWCSPIDSYFGSKSFTVFSSALGPISR